MGEQLRRPVQVAEHACGLRLHMQRRLVERRLQASGVFAGHLRLGERTLVVAVLERDAAQPEVGERERLRVADRLRRLQRRLVPRARLLHGALPQREQPVAVQRQREGPRGVLGPVEHGREEAAPAGDVAGIHPDAPGMGRQLYARLLVEDAGCLHQPIALRCEPIHRLAGRRGPAERRWKRPVRRPREVEQALCLFARHPCERSGAPGRGLGFGAGSTRGLPRPLGFLVISRIDRLQLQLSPSDPNTAAAASHRLRTERAGNMALGGRGN